MALLVYRYASTFVFLINRSSTYIRGIIKREGKAYPYDFHANCGKLRVRYRHRQHYGVMWRHDFFSVARITVVFAAIMTSVACLYFQRSRTKRQTRVPPQNNQVMLPCSQKHVGRAAPQVLSAIHTGCCCCSYHLKPWAGSGFERENSSKHNALDFLQLGRRSLVSGDVP